MKKENLINKKFGRLTVISSAPNKNKKTCWYCKCDCGKYITVMSTHLKNGHTTSCGCFHNEQVIKSNSQQNKIIIKDNSTAYLYDNNNNRTLVDIEDIDRIRQYYWFKYKNDYWGISPKIKNKVGYYYLHQFIMNYHSSLQDKVIDHKNRLKYDNRKANLRIVTQKENSLNRG